MFARFASAALLELLAAGGLLGAQATDTQAGWTQQVGCWHSCWWAWHLRVAGRSWALLGLWQWRSLLALPPGKGS